MSENISNQGYNPDMAREVWAASMVGNAAAEAVEYYQVPSVSEPTPSDDRNKEMWNVIDRNSRELARLARGGEFGLPPHVAKDLPPSLPPSPQEEQDQ